MKGEDPDAAQRRLRQMQQQQIWVQQQIAEKQRRKQEEQELERHYCEPWLPANLQQDVRTEDEGNR